MPMRRQIVTIAVEFDPERCPPPESWAWQEITDHLSGTADIRLLASGAVERVKETTI